MTKIEKEIKNYLELEFVADRFFMGSRSDEREEHWLNISREYRESANNLIRKLPEEVRITSSIKYVREFKI